MLSPSWRQVTHALLTRPPLSSSKIIPKKSFRRFSLDLHVLGTPPAFVLSQDQTLEKIFSENWLAQFWILTFFVKFAKTFLELTRSYTLCNCRNSTNVLITAFLTVYFSNITSQLVFLLGQLCDLRLYRRLLLSPKKSLIFREPCFVRALWECLSFWESLSNISHRLSFVNPFFEIF